MTHEFKVGDEVQCTFWKHNRSCRIIKLRACFVDNNMHMQALLSIGYKHKSVWTGREYEIFWYYLKNLRHVDPYRFC